MLEDYDPSRSPVSYDVMYLPFPYIYGAMFGWDVPSRVDPLLSRHVSLLTIYGVVEMACKSNYVVRTATFPRSQTERWSDRIDGMVV